MKAIQIQQRNMRIDISGLLCLLQGQPMLVMWRLCINWPASLASIVSC